MGPHRNVHSQRLPDPESQRIARQIAQALAEPRPDDPRDDILARRFELPPEDEDRVSTALTAIQAGQYATED